MQNVINDYNVNVPKFNNKKIPTFGRYFSDPLNEKPKNTI